MNTTVSSVSDLPNVPAVYAMYGGQHPRLYVAYVGVGGRLRRRIAQHLVERSSSATTGSSAAMLNPDYVTEVHWWEHPGFAQREFLEAAELVAFDLLNPALRSRGGIRELSREIHAGEPFRTEMTALFRGSPTGRLVIPTLQDALERIEALEKRVAELERRLQA